MKVAVIGSRTFRDYARLKGDLDRCLVAWGRFTVVSGGARGADHLGVCWARDRGLPVEIFRPDWSQGPGAGLARNTQIVEASDCVVAFWDGTSRGTADSIRKAEAAGKKVYIRRFVGGRAPAAGPEPG